MSKKVMEVKSDEGISDKRVIPDFVVSTTIQPSLMTEIFSFMPALSLLKCVSVCRSWANILQHKTFLEKHLERGGCLLYLNPCEDGIIRSPYSVIASISGLILEANFESNTYRIRNPTTRQVFDLPHLPYMPNGIFKMAYVRSTCHFNVICFNEKEDNTTQCYVFTLGRNETSWRMLIIPYPNCFREAREGRSIQVLGKDVHYVRGGKNPAYFIEIITLDLESESFAFNTLPRVSFKDTTTILRASWNGYLAFGGIYEDMLHLFVLEDYNNHRWSERRTLGPLTFLFGNPFMLSELLFIDVHGQVLCFSFEDASESFQYILEDDKIITDSPYFEGIEPRDIRKTLVSFRGLRPE